MIDAGRVPSFILWGPPGVGKTTLAQIISNKLEAPFYTLSAISSGVKDVRDVIEKAKSNRFFNTVSPILFIDEIHRLNKVVEEILYPAMEDTSFQQIPARFLAECSGNGCGDVDWSYNGKPFFRSDPSALIQVPGICTEIIG